MGLEEYRKKRDFRRTPEPAGEVRGTKRGEPLEFVVQKHHASHLHYDFRLELDGTLKSWAVPKGPSLIPAVRRLAMHVEDHPLEYGSFEGVIPEGEYGGGTVLLWDRGVWWPEGDASELYRKGRLKFTLEGEKLRGRWNLVRTRGAEDAKESWLLIKDRDEESLSKGDADITDTRPESVVSGRTLEEIAADRDRVWHSNREDARKSTRKRGIARRLAEAAEKAKAARVAERADPSTIQGARKGGLPRELKAQLATLVTTVPDGEEWIHEIKFDGYRLLVTVQDGTARLVTRNGKDWTARFPGVAEAAAALACDTALLDGEAVVLDDRGVSSFQALQNALGRKRGAADVSFFAFDLLYLDGWDLTHAPLLARKELLSALVAENTGTVIRYSDHVAGNGRAFYAQACGIAGLEGILCKRGDRPHQGGRTTDWLKIKCLQRQEFVVVGYSEPSGSRQGFGALLLGVHDDDGQLVFAGKVGTGFSDRTLRELYAKLQRLERRTPAVVNAPTGAGARSVHWVEPRLVAEVTFAEWTADNRIRHPSFQGLREDKPASEVRRERPKRAASNGGTRAQKTGAGRKQTGTRVAGVAISNAGRVLYTETGVTKGDVARYWEAVWPAARPHLLDRPLTLVRCPAGPQEQCFYQKHWGKGMPDAVPRISIEESDGPELYMYIDDLPALISLVQFGVLEFHVWNAKRDRVDRPDQMMFDLDPDEDLPWPDVVTAAVTMREVLDGLGLQSFVKTTGGKGLHVVMPLQRRSTWEEVRDFTQGVAESFAKAEPDRFTAVMSKRRRTGRIYIDYLRNAYNATAIAAYSTRTKPGATVSVPLTWEELAAGDERPVFTLQNVPARVQAQRRDPWQGYDEVKQSITARMLEAVQ